jgi:hypothetical protein
MQPGQPRRRKPRYRISRGLCRIHRAIGPSRCDRNPFAKDRLSPRHSHRSSPLRSTYRDRSTRLLGQWPRHRSGVRSLPRPSRLPDRASIRRCPPAGPARCRERRCRRASFRARVPKSHASCASVGTKDAPRRVLTCTGHATWSICDRVAKDLLFGLRNGRENQRRTRSRNPRLALPGCGSTTKPRPTIVAAPWPSWHEIALLDPPT